ncbi:putative F-box protein [Carex littledalei]|uniref:Putative F-box protein n=1 Tax=Carex littledalei TaxID=544730 RepID=A0A833REE4_9POAL|nr:putative F-box protein [Carex littledalei]
MATWNDLPSDLLISISNRLDILSCIHFSAVCTAWSSTLRPRLPTFPRFRHDRPIPWILYGGTQKYPFIDITKFNFYDVSKDISYRITSPILLSSFYNTHWLGSNFGWLVFMDRKLQLHLISPLAGAQVLLPSIKLPHGYQGNLIDHWNTHRCYKKVIPCRVPYHGSDSNTGLFLLCLLWPQGLAVLKVGDQKWTCLDLKRMYTDAIIYQGKIYAMTTNSLQCWELKGSSFKVGKVIKIKNIMLNHLIKYIVETSGKLLMVCKKHLSNSGNAISVYEVDLDRRGQPVSPVKSLGDNAVFIGLGYSRIVSTVGLNGVQGDCIYYVCNNYNFDSGVYNLKKGTYEQFSFSYIMMDSAVWFWPCDVK